MGITLFTTILRLKMILFIVTRGIERKGRKKKYFYCINKCTIIERICACDLSCDMLNDFFVVSEKSKTNFQCFLWSLVKCL